MNIPWQEERRAVADTARRMLDLGLVAGTSGNVSLRLPPDQDHKDLFAVTPSGVSYDGMRAEDVVVADFDIEPLAGEMTASSESLLHVAIYEARPGVASVIHTHSVFATIAAVAGADIPPIVDEMVVSLGGPVRVASYGFPGSPELAGNVCEALGESSAALIRSHGAVGVGRTLDEALEVCAMVERAAQIFVMASLMGKDILPLPQEVVEAEIAVYRMRHGMHR